MANGLLDFTIFTKQTQNIARDRPQLLNEYWDDDECRPETYLIHHGRTQFTNNVPALLSEQQVVEYEFKTSNSWPGGHVL